MTVTINTNILVQTMLTDKPNLKFLTSLNKHPLRTRLLSKSMKTNCPKKINKFGICKMRMSIEKSCGKPKKIEYSRSIKFK